MHVQAKLLLEFSKLGSHALADRRASHGDPPSLFFPLICWKPRKSNVSGFPSPLPFPFLFGKPAEFDPARLIRVKFQSELGKSLA
jgi:hypothetical protein